MKKQYKFKYHIVVSFLIVVLAVISSIIEKQMINSNILSVIKSIFTEKNKGDAAGIGIIGSADGQTSILVSSSKAPWNYLLPICLFVFLLVMYLSVRTFVLRRIKKEKLKK